MNSRTTMSSRSILPSPSQRPSAGLRVNAVRPPKRSTSSRRRSAKAFRGCGRPALSFSGSRISISVTRREGGPGMGPPLPVLFAAQRVFDPADRVLDLSRRLVGFAFVLQLAVAHRLAGRFLDGALGLIGRTL